MNLETTIPAGLWEAVRVNYEKRDFTAAILDCCYFISDLLRQKSGSDGDGVPLVGQALGGTNPKIRIARDQSETEQNVQKGIESILRGFYQAIRNPRSHKKVIDSAEDGTSIIMFCGYLVKQLEQARSLASKEELIRRALDKDFVPNDQYAKLFLSEIPSRLRSEVFFGVYEKISEWDTRPIYFFNKHILRELSADEKSSIIEVISNDLKITDDERVIRHIMSGIPAEIWPDVADIARLRIENKIIGSIRDGKYDIRSRRCLSGALATWSRSQFPHFMLKRELILAITAKLGSLDSQARDYAFEYFAHGLFEDFKLEELGPAHRLFMRKLNDGEKQFYSALFITSQKKWSPELVVAYNEYVSKFGDALDDEIPW